MVCNGDEVAEIVFATTSENDIAYSWSIDTEIGTQSLTGVGNIPLFEADNDTNDPIVAIVTVTPSNDETDPSLTCEGSSIEFTITVNPTAQVDDIDDVVLCNGDASLPIEFSTLVGGGNTSYSWVNNNPSIGLDPSGTDTIDSFISINDTNEVIEAVITVTPIFEGSAGGTCSGDSKQFSIFINPSADVIKPNDLILCDDDPLIVIFESSVSDGVTTYSWVSDIDIGGGLAGNGNMDFTVQNFEITTVTAEITVTPIFENLGQICNGPSETFYINVNGQINDQETISDYNGSTISCFGANDAFIEIEPIGGTPFNTAPIYDFNWIGSDGFVSSDQNIYNLAPGSYQLTITDSVGCDYSFDYIITEPLPLEIVVNSEDDILCNGAKTGAIDISPVGGIEPYEFNWTYNGDAFADTEDISDLYPGIYVLILDDANGCGPVTEIFEITEPTPVESTLDSQVDILCFGENTGSLEITPSGGTPTILADGTLQYSYYWTGPNGYTSSDQDIFNLFAGEYILTITDGNDCDFELIYNLIQPEDLIIDYITTDNTCYESNDGSISLDIQGGVPPYEIFWSNFGNGTEQTNLSAGIYDVTVIDSHDCEELVSIEIIEAPLFDTDPVYTNISCYGETDGYIHLNISGGVAPVFVTWDDDPSAGEERNNLQAGTYNVLVADSSGNNCTITHEFIILEPQELTLNGVIQNPVDCNNVNSGSIDLQIIGGTSPFTVQWSNGQNFEDLVDIPAGNYSVLVTDSMGCEAQAQFELNRPSDINIELTIDYDPDCGTGVITQITTANISGGVPPYQINWSDGDVSGVNGEVMSTTQEGSYILEIIDSLGCINQEIFDIDFDVIGIPSFTFDSSGIVLCDAIAVNDIIEFSNTSTGDYSNIIWDFGDGSPTLSGVENPQHIYLYEGVYEVSLTVEYSYGCTDLYSEIIQVTEGYDLILPNTFTPNGDGINDTIRPWYKCLTFVEMSIYDTLGSLLYIESGTGDLAGWDGLINGKPAENGNYILVVRAVSISGKNIEINGPVTLVK